MEKVKQLRDVKFSITHRCWYILFDAGTIKKVVDLFSGVARVTVANTVTTSLVKDDGGATTTTMGDKLLTLVGEKLSLKGYSDHTQRAYQDQLKGFMQYYKTEHPAMLGEQEIRRYLLYLIQEKSVSRSTQNQAINAIKFLYEKVLGEARRVYHLERPHKELKLPSVMNHHELQSLFSSCANLKHRLMLSIIYSAGLRRSELLNLRVGDVDLHRCVVHIRGGKGRKDRQSILAKSIIGDVTEYISTYKPEHWLFEGVGKQRYSETSLQKIFKRAVARAGIRKAVTLHCLRHSFATHLLESGASTRYIQVLLGHNSVKTTEIYTHVATTDLTQLVSPLDRLYLKGK
ncbi:tyrosine-type recombinase/integrase [Pseudochryseolinea flava]|nr:tyrosine-type recombinase/integrase [Pseudochryseolinea flava]